MEKIFSYQNKNFSVMGDSISTLLGCNPPDYEVFYKWDECFKANVFSSSDTWWGMVMEALGGFRLINNSFSGTLVCKEDACKIESYGCSDERTSGLGTEEESPDVIMILMGLNDFGKGMQIFPDSNKKAASCRSQLLAYPSFACIQTMQNGEVDSSNFPWYKKDLTVFSVAYDTMLKKIKSNYPEAEIWCLTLPYGYRKNAPDQKPPLVHYGHHISEYCEAIRICAAENGCKLLDIFHPEAPYDTIDDHHPNLDGMKTIAKDVLYALERLETHK